MATIPTAVAARRVVAVHSYQSLFGPSSGRGPSYPQQEASAPPRGRAPGLGPIEFGATEAKKHLALDSFAGLIYMGPILLVEGRRLMRFASDSRERALVPLEMAQQHPKFKIQILHLANQWLTFAIIEDMIDAWAEEAKKGNCRLH
jgi:hypothetical protein